MVYVTIISIDVGWVFKIGLVYFFLRSMILRTRLHRMDRHISSFAAINLYSSYILMMDRSKISFGT